MSSQRISPERLIAAMERMGIESDAELARRLHLKSRLAPGKWKRGETTPAGDTLNRLCTVLGVTPAYLFGEEETPADDLARLLAQLTPAQREVIRATAAALLGKPAPVPIPAPTPAEAPARKARAPKLPAPPPPPPARPGRHR